MRIPFATQAHARPTQALQPTFARNVYLEATPGGPGEAALIGRPALIERYAVGEGPIRGVFRSPGVFAGSVFFVSGDRLFRLTEEVGAVSPEGGPVRWAASDTELVVLAGGRAYRYAHGQIRPLANPNLPRLSETFQLGARHYYVQANSDVVWFSALNDCRKVDALNFFTIESKPDAVTAAAVVGDEVLFIGPSGAEFWSQTGSPDAPLAAAPGRKLDKGTLSQHTVQPFDNGLVMVGSDRVVYRIGAGAQRISTHGIEDELAACEDIEAASALVLRHHGHEFYALNVPGRGSWIYDAASGQWFAWDSYGHTGLRVGCGVMDGAEAWLGDRITGQVWKLDAEAHKDDVDPIIREVSCHAPIEAGCAYLDSVTLHATRGGNGASPSTVEMCFSLDGGRTWSTWRPRALGTRGAYRSRSVWRRLGRVRSDGVIFRFRCAETTRFNAYYVTLNEPQP